MSVVEEAIRKMNLQGKELAVACSGGLDSTVLVAACVASELRPTLIHVNYHLRGKESDGDEAFVRSLAATYGLTIQVTSCPLERTKGKGINLQDAARHFRQGLFNQFVAQSPNHVVLLAHHQDDQVETFFLQLLRGAGLLGLGGMHSENQQKLRPFLSLRKADLREYAETNKIHWREDSSNAAVDYRRNLFRQVLIPQLEQNFPSLRSSILLLQEHFRAEQNRLKEGLETRIQTWKKALQIPYSAWNQLCFVEKQLVCRIFHWPNWVIPRLDALEHTSLSARIDNTPLFRTKQGFSWVPNIDFNEIWEFKYETIGFLPNQFDLWSLILPIPWDDNRMIIRPAQASDSFHKKGASGSSTVYKILKDAGVPQQWRSTYPILFIDDQAYWIPGIALANRELNANPDTMFLKLKIEVNRFFLEKMYD